MSQCIRITSTLQQHSSAECGKDKICFADSEKNVVLTTTFQWIILATIFLILSGIVGLVLAYVD